jgi:feruloyl esterase
MLTRTASAIALAPLASLTLLCSVAQANSGASDCARFSAAAFRDTSISAAREISANEATGTPAFCEIVATLTPVPGSHVGVVYRLPDEWNGKLLGLGGGGWAGNVRLETAAPGLSHGYATAQTDGGHESTNVWDTSWAASPQAVDDFAFRAIHLMTVTGKAIVAKYYGRRQSQAYFQGCSTGGRQGLIEVQRYPEDYNGVISGAPVYSLTTQTMALLRSQAFAQPGATVTTRQLAHLNQAALAVCDAQDGLKDGIVTDPRTCTFDPSLVQCHAGDTGDECLSASQVAAVRAMYQGVKTASGEYASYPLSRGSELGWSLYIPTSKPADSVALATTVAGAGLGGLRKALLGDSDFDLMQFTAERDYQKVRTSEFARLYEATNPDIRGFVRQGGKLILWHGFDDAGPSPLATIDYYEKVHRVTGDKAGPLDASLRFFLAPGVYHCRGGPGADTFDTLAALDQWVAEGKAPEQMLATRADRKLSRPLCRYPAQPRYKGSGDPNEAASFDCQ